MNWFERATVIVVLWAATLFLGYFWAAKAYIPTVNGLRAALDSAQLAHTAKPLDQTLVRNPDSK